ncbi:MAG: peptide-methionine (S)-S-oxide reductase MsrA, partial [Cytophagaceae bacterium]|nr:peptide-methionine (S)-S-oxide reductase MsrA [Cytophagaceae bacterium]
MKYTAFVLLSLLMGCAQPQANQTKDKAPAQLPSTQPGEAIATLAGGCFWCVEEELESLKGVRDVVSGYAGGESENPTYEQVGTDLTGHAEAVQVYYDPNVISYDVMLDAFFAGHDPTTLNRQGPDAGTQYRSVAFYRNADEKSRIEAAVKRASGHYENKIVTQVVPFEAFYPAEKYHQG